MKFNKILSMLLAVIMIATALIVAIPPIDVQAANSAEVNDFNIGENLYMYNYVNGEPKKDDGKKDEYFYTPANFAKKFETIGSAQELLERELADNMLMSANSADGMYTIYVNVYTGFMYYKNNLNGQILMSNYYRYNTKDTPSDELFSQISLEYYTVGSDSATAMHSFGSAARYNQIYVTKLTNGLRVNYTLGDTTLRYLVPGAISEEDYMNILVEPILERWLAAVREEIIPVNEETGAVDGQAWLEFQSKYYGHVNKDQDHLPNLENSKDIAKQFLINYLKFYDLKSTSLLNNNSSTQFRALFDLGGIVMNKGVTGPSQSAGFVTSGAIDDFASVFTTLAQFFNINNVVRYCPAHKAGGTAQDPDHCRRCGAELSENTVAQYLFYDFNGQLNVKALYKYVEFIRDTLTKVFDKDNAGYEDGDVKFDFEIPLRDEVFNPFYSSLLKGYDNATTEDGRPYVECKISKTEYSKFVQLQKLIEETCLFIDDPTYTYNKMFKDEKTFGYVHESEPRPVFRCALEYTFNDDGSLCVTLPANSISFDESKYTLKKIVPLKYFGSGYLSNVDYNGYQSGYIFYPDGSGTVMNFKDFSNGQITTHAPVYGVDHAYADVSNLVGSTKEQITMPVYGMVYTEKTSAATKALTGTDTLNNGFFAVIEEGASLATLWADLNYATNKFAATYAEYQPYPADVYDLSQAISVSAGTEQRMVSEANYNGSYKTRISMLSDEKLSAATGFNNYKSSYVGMAACYRDYLKANGTISAIADLGNDLPLYVEAFGSMEITKKILSFPVEVSMELTTFENIRTMYDEFADAKGMIHAKAVEYQQKADAEEKDLKLKKLYEDKAANYLALEAKISNITNINFRLTGFANGGMEYTYPSKVKWDKVVGGKSGFEELLTYSGDVATREGANLGLYPDFDFLYINNTSLFDGISANKISSKLIDNRYATKQLYSSVTSSYESLVTSVVSADALADLYVKFNEDFADFNLKSISVSTLGSDVNSNFDDKNPINRDEATVYISDILSSMRDDGYDIMVNKGNAYSLEYASHIIDAYIDSSHLTYSSYAVPFFGMVFHGYLNYAGNALNYSGDPNYDILRSIESGASLYYILCYQNTEKMKEDLDLNKYYGVSYTNWFDKIVEQYSIINSAIGDLQTYEIVDHKILKVESLIGETERKAAYNLLVNEFIENVKSQIKAKVYEAYDQMNNDQDFGRGVNVSIDIEAIIDEAETMLNLVNNKQVPDAYAAEIKDNIRAYLVQIEKQINDEYGITASQNPVLIVFDDLAEYDSEYNYVTDSSSTAGGDYVNTDYTLDNYNVVMVTYKNPTTAHEVTFVLNYNIDDVIVKLDNAESFILGKYDFKVIK